MLSQKSIIHKWLHDYSSITGKEAMEKCGVYRLSDCIYTLRGELDGGRWEIITTYFNVTNKHTGRVSRPARYVLQEKKK